MLTAILVFSILSFLMWGGTAGVFIYEVLAELAEKKREREKSLKKGSDEDKK